MTLDAQGNLYGTTFTGGPGGGGTVFEIAAGTNTLSVLASFDGLNGASPLSGLTFDAQGNLYGTTNAGTIFEIAGGTHALSTLFDFRGSGGASLIGGVTLDAQGNLYGTTTNTVFELINTGNAVVPEPASVVIFAQAATTLGIALAARARARRVC